jgi:hypothetical protein
MPHCGKQLFLISLGEKHMLQENLVKAGQTASLLISDLRDSIRSLPKRPEGPSMGDIAIHRLLAEAIEKVAQVESLLVELGGAVQEQRE